MESNGLSALANRRQRNLEDRRQRTVGEPRHPKADGEQGQTTEALDEQGRPMFAVLQIEDIALNPENPVDRYEGEKFDQLVESLREAGQEQAITVVPRSVYVTAFPQHRKTIGAVPYVVVMGGRRRAAAPKAGVTKLAAWIKYDLSDEEGFTVAAFIENYHRQSFQPVQEGRAFQLLLRRYKTQTAVAKALGVSQGLVSQRIQLVEDLVPELAEAVDDGEVTVREARVLAKWTEEEQRAHAKTVRQSTVPAQSGAADLETDPDEAKPDAGSSAESTDAAGGEPEATQTQAESALTPTARRRAAGRTLVAEAASGRVRLTIDPNDPAEILEKLREKVGAEVLEQLALLLTDATGATI